MDQGMADVGANGSDVNVTASSAIARVELGALISTSGLAWISARATKTSTKRRQNRTRMARRRNLDRPRAGRLSRVDFFGNNVGQSRVWLRDLGMTLSAAWFENVLSSSDF